MQAREEARALMICAYMSRVRSHRMAAASVATAPRPPTMRKVYLRPPGTVPEHGNRVPYTLISLISSLTYRIHMMVPDIPDESGLLKIW